MNRIFSAPPTVINRLPKTQSMEVPLGSGEPSIHVLHANTSPFSAIKSVKLGCLPEVMMSVLLAALMSLMMVLDTLSRGAKVVSSSDSGAF